MRRVRQTPAFKWLLIFLLPVTFAWKLAAERPALGETQKRIVQFLAVQSFDVTEEMPVKNIPVVRATKGDCSMIVAEGASDGSTRSIVSHFATATDRQFVVFRGTIYDEQPTWLTVTDRRWTDYLRKLGMSEPESPPIMVVASHSCRAERLPWAELSAGREIIRP